MQIFDAAIDLVDLWSISGRPLSGVKYRLLRPILPDSGANPGGGRPEQIDRCVKYLQSLGGGGRGGGGTAAAGGEQPFALYCSVLDPHPPYFTNSTWLSQIDDAALDATINATRWQPLNLMHPADRFQFEAEGVPAEYDRALARRLARAWHGQTAETDAMMGAVLSALEASPAASSTFILFTSDHGEMHLEHRHVEKMTHYEGSARIPLIIAGPGIARGRTETSLVSLLDVFPTFVDVAGAAPPSFLDGFSLLPLAGVAGSHDRRTRPAYVAAMAASDSLNAGQFMLRRGRYKLIAYATATDPAAFAPQLFDIDGNGGDERGDIWEMHDIAAEHPELVSSMDKALLAEIDYPAVMREYEAEGKAWARRWTAAFPNEGWKPLLRVAWKGFTSTDENKFMRWLVT